MPKLYLITCNNNSKPFNPLSRTMSTKFKSDSYNDNNAYITNKLQFNYTMNEAKNIYR